MPSCAAAAPAARTAAIPAPSKSPPEAISGSVGDRRRRAGAARAGRSPAGRGRRRSRDARPPRSPGGRGRRPRPRPPTRPRPGVVTVTQTAHPARMQRLDLSGARRAEGGGDDRHRELGGERELAPRTSRRHTEAPPARPRARSAPRNARPRRRRRATPAGAKTFSPKGRSVSPRSSATSAATASGSRYPAARNPSPPASHTAAASRRRRDPARHRRLHDRQRQIPHVEHEPDPSASDAAERRRPLDEPPAVREGRSRRRSSRPICARTPRPRSAGRTGRGRSRSTPARTRGGAEASASPPCPPPPGRPGGRRRRAASIRAGGRRGGGGVDGDRVEGGAVGDAAAAVADHQLDVVGAAGAEGFGGGAGEARSGARR